MRVGLVGSSGFIARHIIKKLDSKYDIIKFARKEECDVFLDLNNMDDFDFESLYKLDYLVFTAAVSSPDVCQKEFEKCWNINVENTSKLIENALDCNCKVIFLSSDAVYGNIEGKLYDETSACKPLTAYGKMKRAVEERFASNKNFKSLRLSYVVSKDDKFVKYCLECAENEEIADVFHPFYRSCITVSDVVAVIRWIIEHWEVCEERIINVSGNELISRVRIVDEMNRYINKKIRYKIVLPDEMFFQNRPRITQVNNGVIKKYNILNMETFSKKIRKELEEI